MHTPIPIPTPTAASTPAHSFNRRALLYTSLMYASLVWVSGIGAPAAAQTPTPTPTLPSVAAAELPNAQWLGGAQMRFLGLRIYEARLWAGAGFTSSAYAQSPLALELEYARSLDGSAIAERSLQEMRRVGPITAAQAQRWLAAMQALFPNMQAGDRMMGLYLPEVGVRFWHNGTLRGTVAEPEFGRYFFGIWLHPNTSEPRMRTALLGAAPP